MEIKGLQQLEAIGSGGFSTVYRAWESEVGRYVAAKVLNRRLSDDGDREQFSAEVKSMGLLSSHPNVVKIHRPTFTEQGNPAIIMEYVANGTLADSNLSQDRVISFGVQLASALAYGHERGLIHNDVKPSNVLIDEFGNPKLADFGISALTVAGESTKTHALSFKYAAPEVIDGTPSRLSDVYSLAATLYRALTQHLPFQRLAEEERGVSDLEWGTRTLAEAPVSLVKHGLAKELDLVVRRKGLARIEDGRPSAEEFGHLLRGLEQRLGYPATAWPKSSAPRVRAANVERSRPSIEAVDESPRTVVRRNRAESLDDFSVTDPPKPRGAAIDRKVMAGGAGITALLLVGLLLMLGRGGERPTLDSAASPDQALPTLEVLSTVLAPRDLRIERVSGGAARVSWADPNEVAPAFEVQFVDNAGTLGDVERVDVQELVISSVADADSLCVVVRAVGEAGRVSSDRGPVCLESAVGGVPRISIVPEACRAGECDFRLDAADFSPGGTASILVEGPDGVDLNAQFGTVYEQSAAIDSDGSIAWFFNPGTAAPAGSYRVVATDDRTGLSSTDFLELLQE